MSRFRHLRTVLMSVWLLLVVGIAVAIARQDRFFSVDSKRVAIIEKKSGPVQVRQEGLVRWQETVEKQGLLDGDRIATGRAGTVRVGFGVGRSVSLGEDTQIQITAITTASRDAAFMIALLRGSMVAAIDGKCAGCPPLVVRAGNDTYRVGVGMKTGIFKPVGKKARKFNPAGPWPATRGIPPPLIGVPFLDGPVGK